MMCRVLWVLVASVGIWSAGCTDNVHQTGKPEGPSSERKAGKTTETPAQSSVAEPAEKSAPAQSAADKSRTTAHDDAEALKTLETLGAALKKDKDGQTVEVRFRGAAIDGSFLTALAKLPRLRSLLLQESGVTDESLRGIGLLKTLRNLDLRGCRISNAGMAALSGLAELQVLRLNGKNGATTIDDTGLASVAQLTQLKILLLDHLWIGDEGLKQLVTLKNLEELCLAQTMTTDAAMETIQTLANLRKLRISATQVTSQGLAGVAKLAHLEELDLSENSQVFDDGLVPLAALKSLKDLNLWRVRITDAGVQHLAGIVSLEHLNLDNTQLTDAGLVHLEGLKNLVFLHLGSTAVTDAGLVHLAGLKALQDLTVTRTAVTAAGVEELKKKLPDTTIQLEYVPGE